MSTPSAEEEMPVLLPMTPLTSWNDDTVESVKAELIYNENLQNFQYNDTAPYLEPYVDLMESNFFQTVMENSLKTLQADPKGFGEKPVSVANALPSSISANKKASMTPAKKNLSSRKQISKVISPSVGETLAPKEVKKVVKTLQKRKVAMTLMESIDPSLLMMRPRIGIRQRQAVPESLKDSKYYASRKRNAEAARRCRERKREVEEQRVIQLRLLCEENMRLKSVNRKLKEGQAELRRMKMEMKRLQNIVDQLLVAQDGFTRKIGEK